jgi:hypothetical protein
LHYPLKLRLLCIGMLRPGLIMLAVCGMVASAATAVQELSPFYQTVDAASTNASFTRLVPVSTYAANIRLHDCAASVVSAPVRMLDEDARLAVNTQCRKLALELTGRSPAMAFAWCVAAVTSAGIGDSVAFEKHLLECHRTAPHELWLAAMRFDMALENGALYEPALRGAVVGDIAILLGSHRGREMVARASAAEPLMLALAAYALEASAPEDRSAFQMALLKAKGGQ